MTMMTIRLGYLAAIALVGLIAAFAPGVLGVSPENFGPFKLFVSLGGFIGIFWLLHEGDAKARRERKGA